MRFAIRRKNFYILLGMDSALIAAAYLLAYFLRFEGVIPSDEWINIRENAPLYPGIQIICFHRIWVVSRDVAIHQLF